MAVTGAGAALTERHRRQQIRLRARVLREFTELWPVWREEEDDSFGLLVHAAVFVALAGYGESRDLSLEYVREFRAAEGAFGTFRPVPAPDFDTRKATARLNAAGSEAYARARRAGRSVGDARETALVGMSGAVTEQVLAGGRETVLASAKADPEARGWARIAGPGACAFCRMMAGRGPVYRTITTASFKPHDHCTCAVEIVYYGYEMNARSKVFSQEYSDAIGEARAAGEYGRGTSNDSLNAYRRYLAARR